MNTSDSPSVVASCCNPCTLPTTLYHPDMKNATLWLRSSCLECCRHPPCSFYGPDTNDATLRSRSSCLGCPCTYSTTLYQPRHEEHNRRVASFMSAPFPAPLPPRHEERDHMVAFFASGGIPPTTSGSFPPVFI